MFKMAQCTACASLWDKFSTISSERQICSDTFTSRLLWFIRSPHNSETTVLFDATWPLGKPSELITLKMRILSEVAMGSVPISYKHTTRKISVIDAALDNSHKLQAVAFSKLTEETALAEATRYLFTPPSEEDGVVMFRGTPESSPTRSEKKQSYLTNKFGLIFLLLLEKPNTSFSQCKTVEYFLCLLESELYTALVSSQNGAVSSDSGFILRANEAFNRFAGNIRYLARMPLVNLPLQRKMKHIDISHLFIDLLMECVAAVEKKEMNYFISAIFSLLLKSLHRFRSSGIGHNLFEADLTKKQTWLILGKSTVLLKCLLVIINLFMMNLANISANGECYNCYGGFTSAYVHSYLPFADIQATTSPATTKSVFTNVIYSMNQTDLLTQDFCIANSYDWLITGMNFNFVENKPLPVLPSIVYPSHLLVTVFEKLSSSFKIGVSKTFCAEYFMQHAIIWSCKDDLIGRACSHSTSKLKAALGCS